MSAATQAPLRAKGFVFVSIFCGTSNSAEASRGRGLPNFEARISARVFHLTSRYTQSLFEPEDEGFRSRLPKEICKMYLPFKGASRRARQGRALWKSGSMKGTQSSQGQLSWSIPEAASHRILAPQTRAPAAPHRCQPLLRRQQETLHFLDMASTTSGRLCAIQNGKTSAEEQDDPICSTSCGCTLIRSVKEHLNLNFKGLRWSKDLITSLG